MGDPGAASADASAAVAGPPSAGPRRRGPDPAVADVRRAVEAALADVPPGVLVLVGCSGGPDSLALAAGLAWWARPGRRGGPRGRGGALVVDHGLQPGSDAAAARAADACRALGLDPVRVATLAPGPARGGGGPEARARDGRHAALLEGAAAEGAVAVLLGHTRDDQAEQVLLALARGSGARSLAGIPPRRGLLRRPLLGLPRATTLAACAALGLEPWHDPTNADPRDGGRPGPGGGPGDGSGGGTGHQRRALVRAHLLPALEADLGPGVAAALARSADLLREDADLLEHLADELLARAVRSPPDVPPAGAPARDGADGAPADPGVDRAAVDPRSADPASVALDAGVLAAAPAVLRRRALRAAAVRAGAPAGDVSAAHAAALDALVTAWRGQGPVRLPGAVEGRRACGRLLLAPAPR
ncbi:tRNA lysidine(34) synthetase TilS [uncultured Pseudokineococcus sp.]|uniref:tRNA lysidine(34) synthetase TilS n=1 Tax=uncultured Pseudokineococcus sp. TaxID=1642928 RepID=UPI002633F7DA|nr:tRNA lysidine(34) synthetase TilS [uncultured Pseudokineococcus sp.]